MGIENLLAAAQKDFEKKFKESETKAQLANDVKPVTGLPVDNPLLEYVLCRRFLPYGRAYLTYGKKGCSKTSLFFDFAKIVQKNGGDVVWIETEHATDLDYARLQGVDTSRLSVIHPESLEEALAMVEALIKNMPKAYPDGNTPVLICLDSIAGVCPDYELQDKVIMGQTKVGEHARLMSHFYRKIIGPLSHEKAFFLAINQLKDKIGGMQGFGGEENAPEALIGGEAQRFHSTFQFKVTRIKDLVLPNKHGVDDKVGSRHTLVPKRNKLGKEGNSRKIEFDLWINGGIDWYSPLVRMLAERYTGVLTKSGGWYQWKLPDMDIPVDQNMREAELAIEISKSAKAKEHIRMLFEIPDLPPEEVVTAVEEEKKAKRRKKATVLDEPGGVKAAD